MRATQLSTLIRGTVVLAGLLAASGCEGPVDPSDGSTPFTVSNPHSSAGAGASVAYVAIPTGGIRGLANAVVQIETTSGTIEASLTAGGLDPVAVPAIAGQTLTLWVQQGTRRQRYHTTVPGFARPIVVRTSPAQGTRDVSLNPIVAIVFSEPIDPSTVDRSSVVLRSDVSAIAGQVALIPGQGTSVTFTPDAPLGPGTEYVLEITEAIRDIDGAALASPLEVRFTTIGGPPIAGAIAFTRVAPYQGGKLLAYRDGQTSRIVLRGSSQSIEEPSWSPDGTRLVATLVAGNLWDADGPELGGDIVLITPASGAGDASWRRLTQDGQSRSAHWAPDGRRIAYVAGPPSQSHLYQMDIDAGVPIHLTAAAGHYATPRWSPDGQRIAFRLDQGTDSEIFVMAIDGTGLINVSRHPSDDWSPNWSPDGRRLVFESERVGSCRDGAQSCDFSDLFVVDSDGGNPTRLTFGETGVWSGDAVWSPDGRRLAFSLGTYFHGWNPDGRSGIYLIDADGSNLVRITASPIGWGDTSPTWTR